MCVFSSFAAELVEALAAEEFFSASINLFIITKNVPSVILYGHLCEKGQSGSERAILGRKGAEKELRRVLNKAKRLKDLAYSLLAHCCFRQS